MSEVGKSLIRAAKQASEIVNRRFGRDHDKPCKRPEVLTCAQWECQQAGECQSILFDAETECCVACGKRH
jgi:hypothetical protein